jgi:hypothetical protein
MDIPGHKRASVIPWALVAVLLPIGMTLILTLLTTTIASDRVFRTYVLLAAATIIAGLVLLAV